MLELCLLIFGVPTTIFVCLALIDAVIEATRQE